MTEIQKKTAGLAVASLVLGIIGFLLSITIIGALIGLPLGLIALILGIIALVNISKNKETLGGAGLAITGIVMSAVSFLMIPIIALMAAIAIPNLLRARLMANEAAAISSLHTISTAAESYRAARNPVTYPPSLSELANANLPYPPLTLGTGVQQGYTFEYSRTDSSHYSCQAKPVTADVTGRRVFYVDESGVIRLNGPGGDPIE